MKKIFTCAGHMRRWFKTVHEGCKDFKCESCGKSLTQGYVKIINEGHKDFKCESCGKSFTEAGYLKKHIKTIHKGQNGI